MTLYFDHNACTPVDPRVLERFLEVEHDCPGNPGSLHTSGRRARSVIEAAREEIGGCLHVSHDAVLFVSGGTEANNLVVSGCGDPGLPVLLAQVEHPSVLAAAEPRGCVTWQVDARGRAMVTAPPQPVGLVCLVHGQNETGALQPVQAAAAVASRIDVPLHVDASQTLGRCDLADVLQNATTVTFSTHKAGGLRGMSVLVTRTDRIRPLLHGGGQQRGLRPGTESPSLCAATALALRLAVAEWQQRATRMSRARDAFMRELGGVVTCLTPLEESLPNTLMLRFDGIDGRVLLPSLDIAGVEASQGSACSSGSPTPPLVLRAMGLSETNARACVRFSFAHTTSVEDAGRGGRIVREVADRLAAGSR